MTTDVVLTRASLKTPKAAAVAGIIFSTMLIGIFLLFRMSVPADPHLPSAWLDNNRKPVELVNLLDIELIP